MDFMLFIDLIDVIMSTTKIRLRRCDAYLNHVCRQSRSIDRSERTVPPGPSRIENDAHGIEKLLLNAQVS